MITLWLLYVIPPAPAERVGILQNRQHFQLFAFTDGSDNETEFEVLQTTAGVPIPEPIARFPANGDMGTQLQVAVDSVDMETNYCYHVRTINEHGSSLSNGRCAKTPSLDVAPPTTDAGEGPQPYAMGRPSENVLSRTGLSNPDRMRPDRGWKLAGARRIFGVTNPRSWNRLRLRA